MHITNAPLVSSSPILPSNSRTAAALPQLLLLLQIVVTPSLYCCFLFSLPIYKT